jgi:mono/diheme cytochrome c family protein
VIPGWDGPTVAALVASERELRQWVLEGRPDRLKAVDAGLRRDPAVPMPAYRGRLSERELGDILVYFRAVSNFGADMPEAVYEGWKAADKMGCFGCHGPGGAGGRPNPGSFKGHIPAWDGAEFRELSRDEGELREWILNGYPQRLWRNPAARLFLEHQVVQMPAYRRHLTTVQTDQLVAYVQWLRKGTRNKTGGEEGSEIIALIGAPGGHP